MAHKRVNEVYDGEQRGHKRSSDSQQKTYERQWRLRIDRGNTGLKIADVPFFGIKKLTYTLPKMCAIQTQTNTRAPVILRPLRLCLLCDSI